MFVRPGRSVPTPAVRHDHDHAPPRAGYRVLGGLEQLYVVDGLEGDRITVSLDGDEVATGTIDRLGSLAVRELEQGRTYTVTNTTSGDVRDVRILRDRRATAAGLLRADPDEGGPQLHPDARRHHARRDRAAPHRPEPRQRTVPDGHRVLGLPGRRRRASRSPTRSRGCSGSPTTRPHPSGETDVGSLLMRLAGIRRRVGAAARLGLLGRRVGPVRPADDLRRLRRRSRPSACSRGSRAAGSAWSASRSRATARSPWPRRNPPHLAAIAPDVVPGQPLRHRPPGRHLQRRLRQVLDRRARAQRPSGTRSRRAALCERAGEDRPAVP